MDLRKRCSMPIEKKRSIANAVVTGATSFLGSSVVNLLLQRGCTVYGLVRPESTSRANLPRDERFHEITTELSDTDRWIGAVGSADTFFHFAWGGPGVQGRANAAVQKQSAQNTMICLEAAACIGVTRFIFSGSQAEYGLVRGMTSETTPCAPISEYGKNKLEVCKKAPSAAAQHGMEYVHTRIFSIYGKNDHPYTLIPSCIRCFLENRTMELSSCQQLWNFLNVNDASEAIVRLAECALDTPSPVVNVAGEDTRPLWQFVEEIHRLTGGLGVCAYGARQGGDTSGDNWPDISYLKRLTGWNQQISFSEGVSELIRDEKRRNGE